MYLEEFRGCQMSFLGNDLSRGAEHWIKGPDAVAEAIGLSPHASQLARTR